MDELWQLVAQGIAGGGLATAIVATVQAITNRRRARADTRKVEADFAQVISSAATSLVEPLRRRAEELEQKLLAAQAEVQQLRTQMAQMTKDLLAAQEELARLKGEPWPRMP